MKLFSEKWYIGAGRILQCVGLQDHSNLYLVRKSFKHSKILSNLSIF